MSSTSHHADREAFQRDGHTVVRGLGTHLDLDRLHTELQPFAEEARSRLAPMEERSTYDRAFLQMFNLWRVNDAFVHPRPSVR